MIPKVLSEIHEGDSGTLLRFQVRNGHNDVVDISSADAVELIFMRPDGSNFTVPAQLAPPADDGSSESYSSSGSIPLDGSDGVAFYVVAPDVLTPSGQWYMQLYIEMGGGGWFSSVVSFTVFPNLIRYQDVIAP